MTAEPLIYRRPNLLAGGFTDAELARMRRVGDLTRVRRGTYIAGAEPADAHHRHRIQVRAAMADLGPGTVVSHASAAVLHGLPTWRLPLRRVVATRARRSGGRRDPLVHLRSAPLRQDEIELVHGVRVTSVARTLVDLARSVPFECAVVTTDAALARLAVTENELREALLRCKGWPGCPRARRVAAFADGRSESVGESRSRVAIGLACLPEPVPQFAVRGPGGELLGRSDFGWPAQRVVGEFDGAVKYGRLVATGQSPGDVVFAEKRREDAIRAAGYTVIRWTWDDLTPFTTTAQRLAQALCP